MLHLGITGIRGMLGSDLKLVAEEAGYEVRGYDLPDFDLTSPGVADEIASSNDLIINCAAYTAVDKAETNIEKAYSINAESVLELGAAVAREGKYMVHISTDFVFGDRILEPLKETDSPYPLSVYGASKLEGEKRLASVCPASSIMRLEWTYGTNGDNFIKKVLKAAQTQPVLKIVNDQIGSPTHTVAVSKAVMRLIEKRAFGLYHYASQGYASRFEVAAFILKEKGIDRELIPCLSSEFVTPAKRPLNSRFDCTKIDLLTGIKRPLWKDELREFLKREF